MESHAMVKVAFRSLQATASKIAEFAHNLHHGDATLAQYISKHDAFADSLRMLRGVLDNANNDEVLCSFPGYESSGVRLLRDSEANLKGLEETIAKVKKHASANHAGRTILTAVGLTMFATAFAKCSDAIELSERSMILLTSMINCRLSQIPGIPIHQPNLATLDDLQASIEATSVVEHQGSSLQRKASKTQELKRLEESARDLVAKASELHATASQCSSSRGPSSIAPSHLSPILPKASIHVVRASRRPLSIASDMPSVFPYPAGQDKTDVDFFVQKTNWEILRNDATRKLNEADFPGAIDSLEKIDNADLKFQPDEATRMHIKRELAFCYLATNNWEEAEPIVKYLTATQAPSPELAQMQHAIALGHYSKDDLSAARHAWAHSMQSKEFLISMDRMHKTDLYDTWNLMADIQLAQGDEILAQGWRERVLDDVYLTQSTSHRVDDFALNNDHLIFGVLSLSRHEFSRRQNWFQTRTKMNRQLSFNRTGRNEEKLDVTPRPPSSPQDEQPNNTKITRSSSLQSVFNGLNRMKTLARRSSLKRANSAPETFQPTTEEPSIPSIDISTKPNIISGIVRTWKWSRRRTKKLRGKTQQPRFDLTGGVEFEEPIEQTHVQRVKTERPKPVQWFTDIPDVSNTVAIMELDGREIGVRPQFDEPTPCLAGETNTERVDDWEGPSAETNRIQQETIIECTQLSSPSLTSVVSDTAEADDVATPAEEACTLEISETARPTPSPDLYSPATPRIMKRINTIDMDEPPPLLRMGSLESTDSDAEDEVLQTPISSEQDQQWRQDLLNEYSAEKVRNSLYLDNSLCDIPELDGEDTMVPTAALCIYDDTG